MHIRLGGARDLSGQIYRQIHEAIVEGRLRAGERVPPTRELAAALRVSRNTVAIAYERLAAEGVLVGRVGSGSYVTSEILPGTGRALTGAVHPRPMWQRLSAAMHQVRNVPAGARRGAVAYDFAPGVPDATLFPYTAWRRLVSAELRKPSAQHAAYGDPAGVAQLREAIARHVGLSRGVRAGADDVCVTNGAQQAFDLIARVLAGDGRTVAVEDPGYPFARLCFASSGADVRPVPVDDEGLMVERIPRQVRIVYVTPSHQFPRGPVMSLRRRAALLAWAEASRGVIVEDDYDSEFRFLSRPLDTLQRLDRNGRVIYVGSFSKVLLPSLRLGFVIAPASLYPALCAARRLAGWHSEIALQTALARFISSGLFARHIRKVSREYEGRHHAVLESLDRHCSSWLRAIPSAAGMHVAAELVDRRVDLRAVLERAARRGVYASTLSDFAMRRLQTDGLVLGYGAIPAVRIDEGIKRLHASGRESQ